MSATQEAEALALLREYARLGDNVATPRPGSLIERTRSLLARIEAAS